MMESNFRRFSGELRVGVVSLALLVTAVPFLGGQPFQLSDSGPGSREWKERFLAGYGVNSAIEPTISNADRPLYEKIAPYLQDDPQRAIEEVERGLKADSNPAFRYLLGNLYYQTGRLRESERYLKEAIGQFPDFRRAHRTLGLILIREERFEEAVDTWLKVITLGGGDAQSYGLLGYAYLSLERYESALTAYRNARMFRPESLDFRRGQAQALLQIGEWLRAVSLFDELISENPENGELWLAQANGYLRLERYGEAIGNLELVQAMGKATPASRFLLGDLHLREGNQRLAVEQYRVAISEGKNWNVEQALRPLEQLFAAGLFVEARGYLEELRPLLPEQLNREQRERLSMADARLAVFSEDKGRARAILEELTAENPIFGPALLLLGEILVEEGEMDRAEFYFTRALSVKKSEVEARIALGRLEVSRENFAAALKHLRIARELDPRPGLSRYIESIERR